MINRINKILLTPGPLNCSKRVKNKMLNEYGSRDQEFIDIIKNVRFNLVKMSCKKNSDMDLSIFS